MIKPFLKSPGGKSWLAPRLVPLIDGCRRYLDPFLGGGAIPLMVRSGWPEVDLVLGDASPLLAGAWQGVQADAAGVEGELASLFARGRDRATYLAVRAEANAGTADLATRAARAIYLNVQGFNGLWRVNKAGRSNVPYGDGRSRGRLDHLREVGAALADRCTITCASWEGIVASAGAGDLLYCDPPYWDTFDGYTAEGFGEASQRALAAALEAAAGRGALVVASNRDTEGVRRAYSWARIEGAAALHKISARAAGRRDGLEVLVASPGSLLDRIGGLGGEVERPDFATKREALEKVWHANYDKIETTEYSEPDRVLPRDSTVLEGWREHFGRDFTTCRSAFYALVGGRRWDTVDWARLREWTGVEWRSPGSDAL